MYPNLKLQMWRRGIRQNRLAKMLAVDETVFSKIVNGFRTPSESLRLQIAALLHSDVEWLFAKYEEGTGENPPGGGAVQPVPQSDREEHS